MKWKKFIEMQEEIERKQQVEDQQAAVKQVLAAQQAAKAKIEHDRKRSRPTDLDDEYAEEPQSKRRKFDSELRDRKRSQSFSSSSDGGSSKSS